MYFLLFFTSANKKYKIYNRFLEIKFGENVRILHYPRWGSEPYLISIGNDVTITRGVSFVNHDGGLALFRKDYPGLNSFGKIKIGNNVFIGINSTILPNVTIGNNVVIGAGSLVTSNISDNSVYAGVPARLIKSFDEYKKNNLKKPFQIKTDLNRKTQILNHLNKNE